MTGQKNPRSQLNTFTFTFKSKYSRPSHSTVNNRQVLCNQVKKDTVIKDGHKENVLKSKSKKPYAMDHVVL